MKTKIHTTSRKKPAAPKPPSSPESITRLRGDLLTVASRVSHDLRTPLNCIFTAGEAMKEIIAEKEPSAVALADSLLNSAEELTQLIRRVSFIIRASVSPHERARVPMGEAVS